MTPKTDMLEFLADIGDRVTHGEVETIFIIALEPSGDLIHDWAGKSRRISMIGALEIAKTDFISEVVDVAAE